MDSEIRAWIIGSLIALSIFSLLLLGLLNETKHQDSRNEICRQLGYDGSKLDQDEERMPYCHRIRNGLIEKYYVSLESKGFLKGYRLKIQKEVQE